MRQVGLQMLCIFCSIRKIATLNSFTKDKRILFHII